MKVVSSVVQVRLARLAPLFSSFASTRSSSVAQFSLCVVRLPDYDGLVAAAKLLQYSIVVFDCSSSTTRSGVSLRLSSSKLRTKEYKYFNDDNSS